MKYLLTYLLVFGLTVFGVTAADAGDKGEKKIDAGDVKTGIISTLPAAVESSQPSGAVRTSTGEQINWQVISSGGAINGSSNNFRLSGTVGQTAVGVGGSVNFGLHHGFWQEFAGSLCDCIPGDANGDLWPPPPYTGINIADAVYLINYVFKNGPGCVPYAICSCDANCDCGVNIADAVYIINYVFKNGPAPCSCEEWRSYCGELHK